MLAIINLIKCRINSHVESFNKEFGTRFTAEFIKVPNNTNLISEYDLEHMLQQLKNDGEKNITIKIEL